MKIRKLKYSEIDFEKYAMCIEHAAQSNLYAKKEVLDFLSGNWVLLVYGDYEAVMPIPLKRKLGVNFVLMPLFCQQLGVFSPVDQENLNEAFRTYLVKNFKVYYYAFNHKNKFQKSIDFRSNYIIPSTSYDALKKRYFKGRKSAVKSAKSNKYKAFALDDNVKIYIAKNFKGIEKKKDLNLFFKYLGLLKAEKNLKIVGSTNSDERINSLALVIEHKDSKYLLGLINDKDCIAENGASFLIDRLLYETIEENNFNFMGGNIRGLEIFFKSFGAENTPFPVVQKSFF